MHEPRDEMQNFPNEMQNHIIRMNISANKMNETTTKTSKCHPALSNLAPKYDITFSRKKPEAWCSGLYETMYI